MSYNMKDITKSLSSLVTTVNTAATKAVKKAATKQKSALLSFDNVESIGIPSKRSAQVIVSGPTLEEVTDENIALENVLNQLAVDMTQEVLTDVQQAIKGVLR